MPDTMKALVYDKSTMPWDKTKGFELRDVPRPHIDEANNPTDGDSVIIKVIFAGFCGSDKGIWHRKAFKGHIFDSLKKEKATTRTIGHEFVGEIVETGSRVFNNFGYKDKDIMASESHIICNNCYQIDKKDNM